jgi:hypothetical protein
VDFILVEAGLVLWDAETDQATEKAAYDRSASGTGEHRTEDAARNDWTDPGEHPRDDAQRPQDPDAGPSSGTRRRPFAPKGPVTWRLIGRRRAQLRVLTAADDAEFPIGVPCVTQGRQSPSCRSAVLEYANDGFFLISGHGVFFRPADRSTAGHGPAPRLRRVLSNANRMPPSGVRDTGPCSSIQWCERFEVPRSEDTMTLHRIAVLGLVLCTSWSTGAEPAQRTPREALQAFNDLIGTWRSTCEPAGTREERRKGFWVEHVAWEWRFKGKDAWLVAAFEKSKHLAAAELHYLPERDRFRLDIVTSGKVKQSFEGELSDRRLSLERHDESGKEDQRFIISLLHPNRHLYSYEVRPAGRTSSALVWQAGATKEGVPFASGDDGPECVVSGGLGTIPVMHNGKTYYVCCTGCRDAFRDEPEKYIKEYEARKKKK